MKRANGTAGIHSGSSFDDFLEEEGYRDEGGEHRHQARASPGSLSRKWLGRKRRNERWRQN